MTEEALIGYVLHYGGMCRDCADMDGVCASGMPCDTDQRKAVVRHTLAALAYGIKHGFIANSFVDAAALAAAEERGRMEERERCENERALAVVEALKAGWLKGRKAWCPAAILEDHERTNRDWQKAFAAITKEPIP